MKILKLISILLAVLLVFTACSSATQNQDQDTKPPPETTTVSQPTPAAVPSVSVGEKPDQPPIQLVTLVVKNDVTLAVDEKEATFPVNTPFIGDDWSKMSPAKFIGSSLGSQMTWDAKTKTVQFHKTWELPPGKYESIVTLTAGKAEYTVRVKGPDGLDATETFAIGAEETAVADAWLVVPARHLAKYLSAETVYDAVTRTVTITPVEPEYAVSGAEPSTTPTASQSPATSRPAEPTATPAPAQPSHTFDMNDPNIKLHPIYATAKTAKELVEANPSGTSGGWRFVTDLIAEMKRDHEDYLIDGKTFYDWRFKAIQTWVDKYLADNNLSIKGKTDYEKTVIIRHVIESGRLEEFIGLWRSGFQFTGGDCVPRAEAVFYLMIALGFEACAPVHCTLGEAHATNAYWDSAAGAVRFVDADNLSHWNCFADELDEWGLALN